MRVMLLDDEGLALMQIQRMLEGYRELTVVGAFQDPGQAIDQAAALQPDVVFLDIHMPEISGFQAAEMLQEICPDADIVFITGYDKYALKAFDLNAVDYLLKPLQQARLEKTVTRLLRRAVTHVPKESPADGMTSIHCFQSIRFKRIGMAPEVPKWRTAKAQELFAFLLHHRGKVVRKGTLMELLWPELDEKKAITQLYTAIYQIRQCLNKMGIDVTIRNSSIQEGYVLDASLVLVDTEEWERAIERIESSSQTDHRELDQILALYEGDYLQDHGYVWAENERERLRRIWLHHARELAGKYAAVESMQAVAIDLYERIQHVDPYDVEDGLVLLRLYDLSGQSEKLNKAYVRLSTLYTEELGVEMPATIVTWFQEWKEKMATSDE
ncbi:response regulator [Tumebacillus lipolyticus]|uniref:Response regulator n=1 Tax=Tumebacillus lipolyticus TaxID=1280370 RepID=A0ABW5A1S1_9BACL